MLIVSLVLVQVLLFAGLIFVFRHILDSNVVSATRHLEELNQDYDKKAQEVDRRLEEAKQKSEEMLAKARGEIEKQKTQIVKEAESEKDNLLNQARVQSGEIIQQADKSRQLLISEMDERIAKASIKKACELIQNTLPEQFKKEVHSKWTEELISGGVDQLKHLHVPQEIQAAKVTSAFPLSGEQRKSLSKKLKQILGRDIELKEGTDSKIVAGIIVTVGSLVLDGSLKNKIQEQVKNI